MACFIHPRLLPVIMIHHIVIIVIVNHHHYLGDNWNIINNDPGTSFHIVVIIIINYHYYLGSINMPVDYRCDDDSWGDISDQVIYEQKGWPLELLCDYSLTHAADNATASKSNSSYNCEITEINIIKYGKRKRSKTTYVGLGDDDDDKDEIFDIEEYDDDDNDDDDYDNFAATTDDDVGNVWAYEYDNTQKATAGKKAIKAGIDLIIIIITTITTITPRRTR